MFTFKIFICINNNNIFAYIKIFFSTKNLALFIIKKINELRKIKIKFNIFIVRHILCKNFTCLRAILQTSNLKD